MKLAKHILIALILGAVAGLVMNLSMPNAFTSIDKYFLTPLGTIFINLIKMLVVPLVFFSIVLGTANIGDPKKLGKIGVKSIVFFLATTAIAITIAIILASIIKPGMVGTFNTEGLSYESQEAPAVTDTLLGIIPTNPVAAFVEANMLQIIFFSVFVGIALAFLGDRVKSALKVIDEGNEIMLYLVSLVMKFAPFGTFGLIASAIGKQGFDAIKAMGLYMIVVLVALIVHFVLVYGGALKFLAKKNPIQFVKDFFPAMTVAFSTSSSGATLPISMKLAQTKLGVPKSISSFVQPLGATVNMDGTAIMQGVATVFIAQVYGVNLTITELAIVVIIAVLASIGTAAVPGAGLIMLAMVLNAVSLPVEGIALIIGIDRILDMARTAVNVSGDAVCAMYVSQTEKGSEEQYTENEKSLPQAQ